MYSTVEPLLCTVQWSPSYVQYSGAPLMYSTVEPLLCTVQWSPSYVQYSGAPLMYSTVEPLLQDTHEIKTPLY